MKAANPSDRWRRRAAVRAGIYYSSYQSPFRAGAAVLAAALLGCLPSSACAQDYLWTTNSDSITIDRYNGAGGAIVVPGTITDLPVRQIGQEAFRNNTNVTSVVISDGITNIDNGAFQYCFGLTNVVFGKDVARIGNSAFFNCYRLTSLTLPQGLATLGSSAFAACHFLAQVEYGNALVSIGDYAFQDCRALTNGRVPFPVASIGREAFSGCHSLTQVELPDTLTNLGYGVYSGCENLTAFVAAPANTVFETVDGVLFSKDHRALLLCPAGSKPVSFTIPQGVTNIGSFAFDRCGELTNVTIPDGVLSLGSSSFFGCSNLSQVCLPDSVTTVGTEAFRFCTRLASVRLGSKLLDLGGAAFDSCAALQNITLPDGICQLDYATFYNCSSLTNISLPPSLLFMSGYTFGNCINLRAVTLPGLAYLGSYNFIGCANLRAVFFAGNPPAELLNVFPGCPQAVVYYLPGTGPWNSTFSGLPTVLWNPRFQSSGISISHGARQWACTVTGTSNIPIVLEASSSLRGAAWTPLAICTLTNGFLRFSDPAWSNCPARFYRIRGDALPMN
jgi:hypothetical protein